MDFEFVTDVTGQPLAKCDVDGEYFADWLSQDISTDKHRIGSLLDELERVLSKQRTSLEFHGKIYHLNVADDEVELFLNNSDIADSEFEDAFSDGPVAGCGLVEFTHLLKSWRQFIG